MRPSPFKTSLLALLAATLGTTPGQAQNHVVKIHKTEVANNDLANGAIVQAGGLVHARIPNRFGGGSSTLAFWIKRDIDADQTSPRPTKDATRDTLINGQVANNDTEGLRVPMSLVPDDSDWHLVHASFEQQLPLTSANDGFLDVNVYIDGAHKWSGVHGPPSVSSSTDEGQINIGSQAWGFAGFGQNKNATESNFYIDDLMVWKESSAEVESVLFAIANLGMDVFDPSDDRLSYYFDFETSRANLLFADSNQTPTSDPPTAQFACASVTTTTSSAWVVDDAPRRKFISVDVVSDYGGGEVIPNVGEILAPYDPTGQSAVEFSAPRYVYLDRYRNELGTDAGEIDRFTDRAFYRARCVGYTVQVGRNTDSVSTSELTFSQASTDDITVIWNWEIDYAGDIDLGTDSIDGLSDSDVSDDTAGLDWYGRDEDVANLPTRFSSEVNASVDGKGLPVRFAVQSYVLENAPNSDERSVVLSPGGDYLYNEDIGFDFTDSSFTIDFWARRDPAFDAPNDQTMVCIGSQFSGGKQIRIGFRSSDAEEPNAFFLGNNAGGTDAFSAFTDDAWHHWAVVNDAATDTVTLYRNGRVIVREAREFQFSGDSAMAVGATLEGTGTSMYFSGGLNNLRVWSTARTASEVADSMKTIEYGEDSDGLIVELTFDEAALAPADNGLQLETYRGTAATAIDSAGLVKGWDLVGTQTVDHIGIELTGEYFGQTYLGQIVVAESGTYEFEITSDDGAVLRVDERIVVDNDGIHAAKTTTSEPLEMEAGVPLSFDLLYFNDAGEASLVLEYKSDELGIPFQALPASILFPPSGPGPFLFTGSTEGRALAFEFVNFDSPFPDGVGADDRIATLFPGFVYMDERDGVNKVHMTTSDGESSFDVTDWTAVHWTWDREFLLTVQASATDVRTLARVAGLPFISGDISQNVSIDSTSANGTFTVTTHEAWVREGAVVTVGTGYRSADGCSQLTGIVGQINNFSSITMDSVVDGTAPGGGVSREYTFDDGVSGPGTLSFQFGPTVHHAEIAIGDGFEVFSTTRVNGQLVPALCGTDPELAIAVEGPQVTSSPRASTNGTPTGGSGPPYVWDYVGQTFYPMVPGEYTLVWPDANESGSSYTIAINAQFPTDTVTIEDREYEDGSRQGTAPDYEVDVTFPSVSDVFPASPVGHYRYVVSDGLDTIPVALDPNDLDRWFFQRMAFSETDDAQVTQGSNLFSSTGAARSVLLFSFRPDATKVATGDPSKEAFAVRVVDAVPVTADVMVYDDVSGETHLRYLRVDKSAGSYGRTTGGGAPYGIGANARRTWQFSARLDSADGTNGVSRILLEVHVDDVADLLQFGVRPPDHENNPGGFYFAQKSHTPPFGERQSLELAEVVLDSRWHNWAIVLGGGALVIYRDGAVVGESDFPFHYDVSSNSNEHHYGYSPVEGSGWLGGDIDNIRIWEEVLDGPAIRDAMLTREPSVDFGGTTVEPSFAITFDGDVTGDTVEKSQGEATGGLLIVDVNGSKATALYDQTEDTFPEVATRILSKLDTAGLGTGFLLNANSNYNPTIYQRAADPGAWGPIYPVNWSGLFQAHRTELHVAWYENPHRALPSSNTILHPDVDWPYVVADYHTVEFPSKGVHKDNRIYIASRLGTEGVDAGGSDTQLVFDPAVYSTPTIYNQPDARSAGYNPNEEHALVAPSIKALLTGVDSFNLQQSAAFALQTQLNRWGENDSNPGSDENQADEFTSEPWVLVQFEDLATGETGMTAYRVEQTRTGTSGQSFPLDILDPETHDPAHYDRLTDPGYDFDYPIFAGDLLVAPYPVNLAVGNLTMTQNTGGNIQVDGVNQRTLWNDKNRNAWAVSGDGRFFYRNWYPLNESFWFDFSPSGGDGTNDYPDGTPIAWLPDGATSTATDFVEGTAGGPVPAYYRSFWRDSYPILKRGETVTYVGGEHQAENPFAEGLPGIVGWASGEVIFDSRTPSMVLSLEGDAGTEDAGEYSARITRPLDRREAEFEQVAFNDIKNANGEALTPASADRVMVVGARWYFRELTGSLQKRFYYDSLFGKLVFRGRLNDLEGGDPNLTATPVSLSILEPNVLSTNDFSALLALGSGNEGWAEAVKDIYKAAQNPSELTEVEPPTSETTPPGFWSGLEDVEDGEGADDSSDSQFDFYTVGADGPKFAYGVNAGEVKHLSSLGTGGALVPSNWLLTEDTDTLLYVTLVENNHPDVAGAVTLHVIEIGKERFRGAIKVVEARDVFDEKINLRHTGDFGGNTERVYYEWYVRDTGALDTIGRPDDTSDGSWQLYDGGVGLNAIAFQGRPDISLADKFFYVRYGEMSEFARIDSVTESDWRLVDINDPLDIWSKDSADSPVPYQWAGASNSPQLQADGSREYIPQLVMGWVKRVLDRVNPYEARFSDFANNDSPSVISSMLQQAGAPYVGNVALNSDKDVIEGVGLIQLYETVLNRARALTLDVDNPSEGANQALLLAATRLAILYEILGREAYTDANIPTVVVSPGSELAATAPFVFPFQNQVASAGHEELALLRGTDFLKAYPVYNRLIWNYVKGLGEAAYNANYAVWDINVDGFINEFDAAELYPQGHGDAWGHLLSASKMHYTLLTAPGFDWLARSEFYSLLDNVIPADYLDEKSFTRIAVAKARTGKEIVRATYRQAYTADPDGQWQGYADSADPARAWGVSEWSHRAGQAAYFDWVVGNALVPEQAEDPSASGLDKIDRQVNQKELGELATAYVEIQTVLDDANSGSNPLGLDPDAVTFDIDGRFLDGRLWERSTHFEQIYDRAITAGQNALHALQFANQAQQQLRRLNGDTVELQRDAIKQDISFRNRLIEIFGTPYEGTIGPGQIYPEGYTGPDTLLYLYIDQVDPEALIPESPSGSNSGSTLRLVRLRGNLEDHRNSLNSLDFNSDIRGVAGKFDAASFTDVFNDLYLTDSPEPIDLETSNLSIDVPVVETGDYAFQADEDWGRRGAYGRIQTTLNEMLAAEIELEIAVDAYSEYVAGLEILNERISLQVNLLEGKQSTRTGFRKGLETLLSLRLIFANTAKALEGLITFAEKSEDAAESFLPIVEGIFAADVAFPMRGTLAIGLLEALATFDNLKAGAEIAEKTLEISADIQELRHELDENRFDEYAEILNLLTEFAQEFKEEANKRNAIGLKIQRLHNLSLDLQSTLAEGLRLLDERDALNKFIASSAQANRYQDMALRLTHNDAVAKYQDALDNAARYAWLAGKAYDYETALSPDDPASATSALEQIVKARQLGLWVDGQPAMGKGGLAEALAQLRENFATLRGELGLNNPDFEAGTLSLRYEHFRISQDASSDDRWREALQGARVDDLWSVPEFVQYCRPFADPADGPQPGIVIDFSTEITPGRNVFGRELGGGDHAYSVSNFATKIAGNAIWLQDYDQSAMSVTPRVYLVPVGSDVMRISGSDGIATRSWNVVEQRIPAPFAINESNLNDLDFIPSIDTVDGSFAALRRTGDSLAFAGVRGIEPDPQTVLNDLGDARHVGRSIWNTRWLLVIPGLALNADPEAGLDRFVESVTDIQLQFETYSHEGQ